MKDGKMIIRWNGLLPIVEDIPEDTIIWDKLSRFMGRVRTMGVYSKQQPTGIEAL
ncbi:MAG: hypothetical protein JSW00_01625 [Thermoplasmata archaeon]|nr:MAG: hypothetical protein JSW00_01625 [Thermoplasmata archaeon]